jgi:hypothetical protein
MGATWRAPQPACRYLLRKLDPDGALVAAGRVGLITHKDCERAMAEALGIPAHRTGHFWGMRGSNALEDCDVLLVVGTPAVRPEHVARLARAFYHADPEVIDEASERGEDGIWRYRDPRMQRVSNALIRAELTRVGTLQPAAALRWARGGDALRGRGPLVFR